MLNVPSEYRQGVGRLPQPIAPLTAKPTIPLPQPIKPLTVNPTIPLPQPINPLTVNPTTPLPQPITAPQAPRSPTLSPTLPTVPAQVTDLSPVELFVETIIAEQDADIADEKEYLGYVKYLLNDQSKYEIFSRLFPNETCAGVVFHMPTEKSPRPIIKPSEEVFLRCIRSHEIEGGSLGVAFTYDNHANMLWIDTTQKVINRYDPQVNANIIGQSIMDETIRTYLGQILPDYLYLGNTLDDYQCVQGVRGQGRMYKSDYYCQDYSLLYALNRIKGMNHDEAAFALVARGEDVLVDLAELLRALAYRTRAELGKEIPERFYNWNPEIGYY